jgi:hypothetical protein
MSIGVSVEEISSLENVIEMYEDILEEGIGSGN